MLTARQAAAQIAAYLLPLPPDRQQEEIYFLRDKRHILTYLLNNHGIQECPRDCMPQRRPCPMHSAWKQWHDAGATASQIARRWESKTGELTKTRTVRRALKRPDPSDCDCITGYFTCRHVEPVDATTVLSLEAISLILLFLEPENYTDPPEAPEPIIAGSREAKATLMGLRTPEYKPMRGDDYPQWGFFAPILDMLSTSSAKGAPA